MRNLFHFQGLLRMRVVQNYFIDVKLQWEPNRKKKYMRKHTNVLLPTFEIWYNENITIETRKWKLLWHWTSRQLLWIEKSKKTLRLWRLKILPHLKFATLMLSETKSKTTFCVNTSDFTTNWCLNSFLVFLRKSLTLMVFILVSVQLALWMKINKNDWWVIPLNFF